MTLAVFGFFVRTVFLLLDFFDTSIGVIIAEFEKERRGGSAVAEVSKKGEHRGSDLNRG